MRELMPMMSGWLLNYLVHSAVALTLIGAVGWLGDLLLRRAGPPAQHRMWIAAFLAAVALPLLPAGMLIHTFGHVDAVAAGTVTVTYSMAAAAAQRWGLTPLSRMLAGAYLLTVLFCVMRLLWRWRRTAALARRSAVLPLDASAGRLVEDAARRFGLTTPEVRCSRETKGPVVLGARRALLLVPEGFLAAQSGTEIKTSAGEDEEDIVAALAHECAHIARQDFAKSLIYEFVASMAAYHPVCWLMRRRIAQTREMICDEMAAAMVGGRPEYAASLVRLATAMAGAAARPIYASETQAIGVFDADILEERIMRLTMDVPKVSRVRKMAMVAVTSGALLGGAVTAMALSFEVTPQAGAATSALVHEKVYKVGGEVTPPVLTYTVDATFPKKAGKETRKAGWHGIS